MFYIIMFTKAILLEYILILCHELIHFIFSKFLNLKASFLYVIPFRIYKKNNRLIFNLSFYYEPGFTSRLHFDAYKLTSSLDYSRLLNKLRLLLWVGPIFDCLIFITLFVLGVSLENSLFLAITALIHLIIATITFFNSDGKYAIGSKEDSRLAFELIRAFTLCGNGYVKEETKRIMTDKHIEISQSINWDFFEVNDLWNFLNNVSFYTNSLSSYLNEDLLSLDDKTEYFIETLINDFDNIKSFDYRQIPKTSISIILYFIYRKIQYKNFIPDYIIADKVLKGCRSIYYVNLYNYYFNTEITDIDLYKDFLLSENNLPSFAYNCFGYNKIFYKLVKLKKYS